MLAALLYGPKDLRLQEVNKPTINDNEILLKTKSSALCGSDIRMILNGYPSINEDNPRILGHEISGEIDQMGKNVKFYKEGMRVAIAPNIGCGLCKHCISGNTHLCKAYRALGIHMDGGFAEYVRIPEEAIRQGNVMELGDNTSFEEAAVNEPLSCVYNGFERCEIKPGDNVLIIGAGPIGLMHAKLAAMAGAAKVMINDVSQERLDICKKVDDSIITIGSDNLKEIIFSLTKGEGLDVCITACPVPQVQTAAMELMAINGRVNFFGGLPAGKEMVPLNTNLIHYKQLIVTGSARASLAQFRKTLDFVESGLLDVKGLVSARVSLENISEAVKLATEASGLKNVINFE